MLRKASKNCGLLQCSIKKVRFDAFFPKENVIFEEIEHFFKKCDLHFEKMSESGTEGKKYQFSNLVIGLNNFK